MLTLLFAQLAPGAPTPSDAPDAEITVYGDALAPWEGTRWWVASETVDLDAPLKLSAGRRETLVPAWQVEAVLECAVSERLRKGGWVRCAVEDAVLRITTYDKWQRPRDQAMVEELLNRVTKEVEGFSMGIRVQGQGSVRLAREQSGRAVLANDILGMAIDAFHLEIPEGGWRNGARWHTFEEPLLALDLRKGTYGFERASHFANAFGGAKLVQTLAEADRRVVAGLRDPSGQLLPGQDGDDDAPIWTRAERDAARFMPENEPGSGITELAERGRLRLHAVADYDVALGGIRERVWTVEGEGAASVFRAGKLRKLGDDEVIELGASMQISPPQNPRDGFPRWVPIAEISP